jgi:two-component system, chemotaxis family, CheB/CheR fusion protein
MMKREEDQFIVAIGASAGGLEAIHEFFDNMTDSAQLSFVIIQHLSPDYKSLLVELVSRHTHMNVYEAKDNLPLQKNCIYVIPNNKLITISENKLMLEAKAVKQAPNNAIDIFMQSLAREKKTKAIAVILSGTGSDGTRGIEAVKNAGGMVIVQDPASARFNGMPNNAILSGNTDFVLPPSGMPEEILYYTRYASFPALAAIPEEKLKEIFALVHAENGFNFEHYKLPTILRRINRRMALVNISNIDDYMALMRKEPAECVQLGKDFLIGVTMFFRDSEAFDVLRNEVLPDILKNKQDQDIVKIWVCACSTGEEAYSLAMLVNEAAEQSGKQLDIRIFASDIDEESVDFAGKGVYPANVMKDIPEEWLEKYFIHKNQQYHIIPRIRKQVVFARHDVSKDPPFINNDFVSCRNMLIYMSGHLQQKVISVLLFSINKNGYLMLGPSENSTLVREYTTEVNGKWKIYRKIKENRIGGHYLPASGDRSSFISNNRRGTLPASQKPRLLWEMMTQTLSEDFNFAAFFIDDSFDIKETAGNYERFLALPKKNLHLNLLGMLPSDIYFVISSEVKKAWKNNTPVAIKNLRFVKEGVTVVWQVSIKPLEPHTLVVITESETIETPVHEKKPNGTYDSSDYIYTLEVELNEAKTKLQLAVEDLETTNEELQSSNEELLSANEELQSSNEELQSLNEELHTLNTEHQLKIKELVELNEDLNNYFRSTDIGQVFLDSSLHIRKFNTASAAMINFIESDIGRPLSHISNNIKDAHFLDDVMHVLRSHGTIEKEMELADGKNVLVRIMPYLSKEKERAGIIISLVDISALTKLNNTFRGVLNSNPSAIVGFRAIRKGNMITDFILDTANYAASFFFEKPVADSIGSSLKQDIPKLASGGLFEQYAEIVETGVTLYKDIYFDEEQKWFSLTAAKLMDGFVGTFTDVTSKKLSEQKLRRNYMELITTKDNLKRANEDLENKVTERTKALGASEERFRLVARATNDALWDWDFVTNTMWWGETFFKIFGYENRDGLNTRSFWLSKIHPKDVTAVMDSISQAINGNKSKWSREYRFQKESGEYIPILDRGYILHDEFGTPYRMLGSIFDLSELKQAEQRIASTIAQRKFLAESMPLIVWTVAPDGKVDFVNEQFELYTGASYKEALGVGWKQFIHEPDLPQLELLWQRAINEYKDFSLEVKMLHRDKKYQWNLLRTKVSKDDKGRIANLVVTITDIHDQKVMNEVLENKVVERTKELADINHALELSNNDLQQFASVASHDLQEPLRKIQMFAAMLRDNFASTLPDNGGRYLDKIIHSSSRMKSLITDILDYSRLSASETNFARTNLNQLIADALDDFEITIKEKGATVKMNELPIVEINPGQVRQVFHNLLSNALKFSRPDVLPVITITGELVAQKNFNSLPEPAGNWCRITVTDNGIGFEKEFAANIFNLFHRLHSKDKFEGSGIGLAITKKIIDKHQGIITAESVENEGATFTIVLPVRQN